MQCEYCNITVKSKYILKTHLISNKNCLKIRGVELGNNFICKGCSTAFINKSNMTNHMETCKKNILLKASEEYDLKMKNLKDDYEFQIKTLKNEYDLTIKNTRDGFESKLDNINQDYKFEIEEQANTIKELQTRLEKTTVDQEKYLTLKVRFEELEKQHDLLGKQHDKTITKLELKIAQCDAFIQTLAREGSNKVTTTHNTVNNTIRNQLSSTYTVDSLEPKQLEDTMRQHYTESDFFGGQKRLADFWVDHVIKTPDNKMMVCCTDVSRKKFKILDIQGNLKEDIEARLLCKKLKVPVKMVTKEIYDTVIERIEAERDRLSSDDRSRREKLLDDSMRAQQMYMDNLNFDDLNYNQDFMHELCVLLNV
jgi:hypothetical protein